MKHIVALSGGKDSTALALLLNEREPRDYEYLCTPTGDELPTMIAHWNGLEVLLGKSITRLSNHTLDFWINEFQALPNWRQRWCTRLLKIEPTIAWLKANVPVTMYVGLRADEEERGGIYGDIEGVSFRFPLREWDIAEQDVWRYLAKNGIDIPKRTDCARCYGQRLAEWKALWREHPEIYADAERQEQGIGNTFRSPGRDTWPASLKELRERFETGENNKGQFSIWNDLEPEQQACRVCSL